ncbi:hypothetical protein [Micromonospora sp. WMMD980]|uniref:hypothetical protein n=1 Tax=Micromonospora sp. WMMD980 TaxID=3016088 RepID=UPI0024169C7F|nr:hypothetical protein [Micromonospora sp. WMMD980]MDG4802029.1 hypothetical protein [Micromonospora sp. WMMD980]
MLGARFAEPENAPFLDRMFRTLDALVEHLGPTPGPTPPTGARLRRWLAAPGAAPPGATDDSVAAGVCVHLMQLCDLQPRRTALDGVAAVLGHSIGLQAAIVAGLRPKRTDDFLKLAETSLRLVALSLVRAHQVTAGPPDLADVPGPPHPAGPPGVAAPARGGGESGSRPAPMAVVSGLSRDDLATLVERYRRESRRPVSVSLVNTPTTGVLSGRTDDLLHFRAHHEPVFRDGAVRWTFLANTVPFHSPHLAPAAEQVRRERDFVGALPPAAALRIPVYAADAPRTLPPGADLVDEFLDQVLVRPVDWATASLHAVTDAGITTVLDCGPGPGARRFTRECLGARARELRFTSIRR